MRRREFIAIAGAAAVWPVSARSQQAPVIGFLRSSNAAGSANLVAGLRQGLSEAGYDEGRNLAIEYRWGEGHVDRLPALAADLVQRKVSVLVASTVAAATAAKAATSTIPIVFVTAVDPVKFGLVAGLSRPGGNATGVAYLTSALGAKRLEYMQQLVPTLKSVGVFLSPNNPGNEVLLRDLEAGARILGIKVLVSWMTREDELDGAFAKLVEQAPGALIVGADPLFTSLAKAIVALADRHKLPAIYTTREFTTAGGLMTWGTSVTEQYRQAGTYVGKILAGAKPADLPVLQPTKYELVLNLKTAKALGIEMPMRLLTLADEVIE